MERVQHPHSSRRAVFVRVALVCGALTAGLVLVEAAARVRARLGGKPYSSWQTTREWRETAASVTATMEQQALGKQPLAGTESKGGLVLGPYVGFDWSHMPKLVHDELEYFQSPKCELVFDVVVVGGSVAAGFGNNGGPRFAEILEADARLGGRRVRVISHGRGGYKQPQQLLWVAYLLSLGYQPDLVLELDGFNELALTTENARLGAHPDQPSVGHWANLVRAGGTDRKTLDAALRVREAQIDVQNLLERAMAWKLHYSAILGPLVATRLKRARATFSQAQDQYAKLLTKETTESYEAAVLGPPFEGDALAVGIRAWAESSRSLAALCAARSIRYMHVLQPTLHDTGSKPLTAEEIAGGTTRDEWIEAIQVGYPRLREAGAALAAEGICFLDASKVFEHVDTTLYTDSCHFGPEGNELLARAIADKLLATIEQPLTKPTPHPSADHPRKKKQGAKR